MVTCKDERTNWQEAAKQSQADCEQIEAAYDVVLEAKQWLETQSNNSQQTAEQRGARVRRLATRSAESERSANKLDNELRR